MQGHNSYFRMTFRGAERIANEFTLKPSLLWPLKFSGAFFIRGG